MIIYWLFEEICYASTSQIKSSLPATEEMDTTAYLIEQNALIRLTTLMSRVILLSINAITFLLLGIYINVLNFFPHR